MVSKGGETVGRLEAGAGEAANEKGDGESEEDTGDIGGHIGEFERAAEARILLGDL